MIPVADYPVILFWFFVTSTPFLVGFGVWITKTLGKQNTLLAILTNESKTSLKLVNEVIDLKLADAKLIETVKTNTENIKRLFSNWEHYYGTHFKEAKHGE